MEKINKESIESLKDDHKKSLPKKKNVLQQNLTIAIFLFTGGMLLGSETPHLAVFLMVTISLMLGYISRDLSEWIQKRISK